MHAPQVPPPAAFPLPPATFLPFIPPEATQQTHSAQSTALKLEQEAVTSHFQTHRERTAIKRERDRFQPQLKELSDAEVWRQSILSKLIGVCDIAQVRNVERCGRDEIYRTCKNCGEVARFFYRCNVKWCPLCNWRIVKERQAIIKRWIQEIKQPKHLVTTQRNVSVLTGKMIRNHTANLARLRRRNVFASVKGGCVSVEITNEGRGWHLHAHWLLDARWIDIGEVSRVWGQLVGQDFAIVAVRDLRGETNYQKELAKYVCKGSDLASWPAEEIHQFIRAVYRRRFYFTFGGMFKSAQAVRKELRREAGCPVAVCDCGCADFRFQDEVARHMQTARNQRKPEIDTLCMVRQV